MRRRETARAHDVREVIADLIPRATFLDERLRRPSSHARARPPDRAMTGVVTARLEHIRQSVAGGDAQMFERWLQFNGLTIDALRRAMQDPPPRRWGPTPSWARTLAALFAEGSAPRRKAATQRRIPRGNARSTPCVDADGRLRLPPVQASLAGESPIPFAEVLLPALRVARRKLLSRFAAAPSPLAFVSAQAYSSLERSLLSRLSFIASPALLSEFDRLRPAGIHLLVSLGAITDDAAKAPGRVQYARFVRVLARDGLRSLCIRYPVLGRFLSVAIDQWVDSTSEFLDRLRADWRVLETRFSQGPLALVTDVDATLSDAHHGGRSAVALAFDGGLRVIYKPKPVALERCYIDFLDWCNHRGLSLELKTHVVVDRRTHGWVELVTEEPCADEAAVARFYRRAGMQLCLLYVLGASDCHAENLIASGEHLVLVDMETLLWAEPWSMSPGDDATAPDSVLRPGLLPCWDCRFDTRHAIDVSGLGFSESQDATYRRWRCVNTDGMHVAWGEWPQGTSRNVPKLRGVAQTPLEYVNDLTAGFEEMYRLLVRHRAALLRAKGPIAAMRDQDVRFVFRPTFVYFRILEASLAPELLGSGIDCSIQLEQLAYAFLDRGERPRAWPILGAEREALEQLDIPYFGCRANSDALTVGLARPLAGYFRHASYGHCTARIRGLSEADLDLQLELIRGSMYCKVAGAHESAEPESARQDVGPRTHAPSRRVSPARLERAAKSLVDQLRRRSIRGTHGELDWLGVSYFQKAGRFRVRQLGDDVFDGRCGVALFLAAYGRIADDAGARALALETLDPVRQRIRSAAQSPHAVYAANPAIGGAIGVGSLIYALSTIGGLLDDPSLLDDARRTADLVTPDVIGADRELDVLTGAAGTSLALLALHARTGDQAILRRALDCGAHVVENHSWSDATSTVTQGTDARQMPGVGFAHGTAGIGYSLIRLHALTADARFRRAADDALAYERRRFPLVAGGVGDHDGHAAHEGIVPSGLIGSWCNGIPGIALGRLFWLTMMNRDDVEEDVDVALATTRDWPVDGIDHVCCGSFGRAEILLVAAERLGRPRLRDAARAIAATLVARAGRAASYRLFGESFGSPLFKASFFQGVSGIGYELLRLAHPEALPSVLSWE